MKSYRKQFPGREGPVHPIRSSDDERVPQRSQRRLPFGFQAELIAHNVTYEAFVENISINGLNLKVVQLSSDHSFDYVSDILLKIHPTFGKRIELNGRKKWSRKNAPNSVIEDIGIEIIDPPPEYKRLYQVISLP